MTGQPSGYRGGGSDFIQGGRPALCGTHPRIYYDVDMLAHSFCADDNKIHQT